jgi:hypothetical protein
MHVRVYEVGGGGKKLICLEARVARNQAEQRRDAKMVVRHNERERLLVTPCLSLKGILEFQSKGRAQFFTFSTKGEDYSLFKKGRHPRDLSATT